MNEEKLISSLAECCDKVNCNDCPFKKERLQVNGVCYLPASLANTLFEAISTRDGEIEALTIAIKQLKKENDALNRIFNQTRLILAPYIKDGMAEELFNIINSLIDIKRRQL